MRRRVLHSETCAEVEDGEGHSGILIICQGEIDKYTPEYVENNVSLRYCSVTEEYYLGPQPGRVTFSDWNGNSAYSNTFNPKFGGGNEP